MLRFDGASGVTRTPDLLITNQLLYRLSYTSILYEKVLAANLNNGYDTTIFPQRQQEFVRSPPIHTARSHITLCIFAGILAFFYPAFFVFSTSFDRFFLSTSKNSKILLDIFLQKLYPFPKFLRFFSRCADAYGLRNFSQRDSLPKVIHILHMVFHIRATIDISRFERILYFFGIPRDESFPHLHHGISFYIISFSSALSLFVFFFPSGHMLFCKCFLSRFQKKQVFFLYIHFLNAKIYKKGGCFQPLFSFYSLISRVA